jgi:DNA-binding response OmpR family regulator
MLQPTRTALVVEDDPALQDAMTRRLEAMRFRVLGAFDYRGALRHLQAAVPDLVFIDLCLPAESGYELCETMRRTPGLACVPIVLTSERAFPDDMACAEKAGANAFLRKPFTMAQLAECVELVLAHGPVSRPWVRRLRWAE